MSECDGQLYIADVEVQQERAADLEVKRQGDHGTERRHATLIQGFTASRQRQPVGCRVACAQVGVVSFERKAVKLVDIAHIELKLEILHQRVPHPTHFFEV